MMHETVVISEQCNRLSLRGISWSAIFVGALVALGLGFLLNLFGMAIGLSAMTVNKTGMHVLAIGGFIGLLIGAIISLVVAGYAAGYLGKTQHPEHNLGILYGFLTWSISLLLSVVLAAHVSQYISMSTHNVVGAPIVNVSQERANISVPSSVVVRQNDNTAQIAVSSESMAYSAFILFALFFIGAISTCTGAYWAMMQQKDN